MKGRLDPRHPFTTTNNNNNNNKADHLLPSYNDEVIKQSVKISQSLEALTRIFPNLVFVSRGTPFQKLPRSSDNMRSALLFFLAALLLLPLVVHGDCDCDCSADEEARDKKAARPLKIVAIFSILGVCIPILGKWIPALDPERDAFFVIKSFAAGVILATAFVHILPDSFDSLTSSCLHPDPWHNFPFAGFGAMIAAIGTLTIDTLATGYFGRPHDAVSDETKTDVEIRSAVVHEENVHVHTHAHAHGHPSPQLIRHRVISQVNNFLALTKGANESLILKDKYTSFSYVHCFWCLVRAAAAAILDYKSGIHLLVCSVYVLELGIVVHSVIIGIALGSSETPSTIKPLVVALSFHQFFEGVGLGGCLVQAKFNPRSAATMGLFFSLTTPVGVAVGMGLSSAYDENSPTALIVEGLLNSASAGILIYMSLVDLLAQDFMNPRVQSKGRLLQVGMNISLLAGAGLMSLLAKWA
ncbi:zinc transporter [Musa troglodytarum]|uniref:Zinc transporter n=1 Tax=Musa troglodytarum TaxID=320322 RepID=A0A9E7G1S9_9LILI|nr:zinc transporter [Musa troglodytarum]